MGLHEKKCRAGPYCRFDTAFDEKLLIGISSGREWGVSTCLLDSVCAYLGAFDCVATSGKNDSLQSTAPIFKEREGEIRWKSSPFYKERMDNGAGGRWNELFD